jgi:hypothetical protein
MFQLLKQANLKKLLVIESIPFGISMLMTESFLKLGSFTLECVAFLSGWYLLSWIANSLLGPSTARKQQ